MNVTEFAEQVVFGATLADKLLDPGQVTGFVSSEQQSAQIASAISSAVSLDSPGRPPELRMQHGAGASPPKMANLGDDRARGQLLHFLANHELLATELMALVLLKFPDAPTSFRQGVLVTLREEQQHTQMYLDRMSECGVEFGSYPVSGHFWRVVEPMQSPMDFVSRLSLTFEQANLDYSKHFAQVFRQIGDQQTAALLEQIYQDEIGHVRHGLHWFRKWKDPGQSDWDAYRARLTFPMSPERARGPKGAFNREGRLQAGLTDDFVDSVEVFRQSRGRTPTVRWFDPAAELALAGDLSPRERELMERLGNDLECLMVPMSKRDDIVLVRRLPTQAFRRQLLDAGFDLPEFITISDRSSLSQRKLHDLSPWAWTPENYELANCLLGATRVPPSPWADDRQELFRKSWSANRYREWITEGSAGVPFVSADCAGIYVESVDDVSSTLDLFADRGFAVVLVKCDLGASGRGQRRMRCDQSPSEQDMAWLRSVIQNGIGVVVEPELNRVFDLSFLWCLDSDAEVATHLGWTRPIVTEGRRFAGTRIGRPISDLSSRLTRFLLADRCKVLERTADWLAERITPELTARRFTGHFGVDAFVCEDLSGELRIKPVVELNPRMTMGHVAVRLEKRLSPGVDAQFRIFTRAQWQEHHEHLASHPLVKARDGRWVSGFIPLAEFDEETRLFPVVLVGDLAEQVAGL